MSRSSEYYRVPVIITKELPKVDAAYCEKMGWVTKPKPEPLKPLSRRAIVRTKIALVKATPKAASETDFTFTHHCLRCGRLLPECVCE